VRTRRFRREGAPWGNPGRVVHRRAQRHSRSAPRAAGGSSGGEPPGGAGEVAVRGSGPGVGRGVGARGGGRPAAGEPRGLVINKGACLHPVGFNTLTDHELATMFRVLFSSP